MTRARRHGSWIVIKQTFFVFTFSKLRCENKSARTDDEQKTQQKYVEQAKESFNLSLCHLFFYFHFSVSFVTEMVKCNPLSMFGNIFFLLTHIYSLHLYFCYIFIFRNELLVLRDLLGLVVRKKFITHRGIMLKKFITILFFLGKSNQPFYIISLKIKFSIELELKLNYPWFDSFNFQ
jgi:hypothetical protein